MQWGGGDALEANHAFRRGVGAAGGSGTSGRRATKSVASGMDLGTELVPTSRLTPYERNPRKNVAAVARVADSIRAFGFRQPIVVDRDYVVVVGHTRLLAAQHLGLTEVPVHVARELTPSQARAYRIADNRAAEAPRGRKGCALKLGRFTAKETTRRLASPAS